MRENLFESLRRQDKEFGDAVEKWWPKISKIASTTANMCGFGVDDVIQDLLLAAWQATAEYRTHSTSMSLASYIYVRLSQWRLELFDRYSATIRTGTKVELVEDLVLSDADVEQQAYNKILFDRCRRLHITPDMHIVLDAAFENIDLLLLLPKERRAAAVSGLTALVEEQHREILDFA